MRYFNQIIISIGLCLSSVAHAVDFYAEALYWQASETVDWALTNNLTLPNQVIAYHTIDFDFAPGFRVGAALQQQDLSERVQYTRYHVTEHAHTSGNVISVYMPSKFAETFYHSGEVSFTIDYHTVDLDLGKTIQLANDLQINPLIGLKGGWINQHINTVYQGNITAYESVSNDFSGFGPKIGVESRWSFYKKDKQQLSLVGDVSSTFMWGSWRINDTMTQSNSSQNSSVQLGKRDLGALELQGLLGVRFDYQPFSFTLGYEIADWFNQYQVFDNAVGTHTNDLVLQGVTAAFTYRA